ncbi:hypothetical protein [Pseudoalteromonas sp. TAB23]|uniref:hypothetical protein n=1 Tax=Pseudoalteromonas sp. TAB23 TaxID=1938595 RepID=UPI0003FC9624|nr:hypothetical protein [Pseudoalteromonas sp. TAB23]
MEKNIFVLALVGVLAGCVTNDYAKFSAESGLSEESLTKNCKEITCTYDELKDRVQATANDSNVMFLLAGSESRTIEYTWVSGNNQIAVDVFSVALYGSWSFYDKAEIYIEKEMVAELSGRTERIIGSYNESAREHEKIEIVSGFLDFETAQIIAEANYETVTIRFYGKDGYHDEKLPRKHDLINVVNLAQSM